MVAPKKANKIDVNLKMITWKYSNILFSSIQQVSTDVSIGTFLSGGIDSVLVTYLFKNFKK